MWRLHLRRSVLLALALLCLGGALLAGPPPTAARSEAELRAFYQRACVGCHGLDGAAKGPDGKALKGRDLTELGGPRGPSDQSLMKTIQGGLFFGLSMPAYRQELTEEETLHLVRSILRKARKGEPIQVPSELSASAR